MTSVEKGTAWCNTTIPIRNVWLLQLYASVLYTEDPRSSRWSSVEDQPDDIPDLVAELLAHETERRLRRRASVAFKVEHAQLSRVRGKIRVLETESRQLLKLGLVACRFDSLSADTFHNRLVLTALQKAASRTTSAAVAARCRSVASILMASGVVNIRPSANQLSTETQGRNNRDDRAMIAAANLVFGLSIPTESMGSSWVVEPGRGMGLRKLFEQAIRGFFRVALDAPWTVGLRQHRFDWPISAVSSGARALMPVMETDTVLENSPAGRRIIIETKFAEGVALGRFGNETFKSAHLYQLYAYLMTQTESDSMASVATGILLYPTVKERIDEHFTIQGHHVRVLSVDLAADAAEIRQQLLRIVETPQPSN